MSNLNPKVWSKNLKKWIAYIPGSFKAAKDPSLSNESAVQKPDKKESVFQKIRGLYGLNASIADETKGVMPGDHTIPAAAEKEDDLVKVDLPKTVQQIRVERNPAYYGENATKPEFTFMQNLEAVRLEFSGIGKGPGKLYEDKNVTDQKNTFLQNLDAISLEFSGKGTGPVEIQTENTYNPRKDFVENLMQASLDSEGNGETLKVINENVTDPKKSLLENLDAAADTFPNMEARLGYIPNTRKKKTAGR